MQFCCGDKVYEIYITPVGYMCDCGKAEVIDDTVQFLSFAAAYLHLQEHLKNDEYFQIENPESPTAFGVPCHKWHEIEAIEFIGQELLERDQLYELADASKVEQFQAACRTALKEYGLDFEFIKTKIQELNSKAVAGSGHLHIDMPFEIWTDEEFEGWKAKQQAIKDAIQEKSLIAGEARLDWYEIQRIAEVFQMFVDHPEQYKWNDGFINESIFNKLKSSLEKD